VIGEFCVPSAPGNEREAAEQVVDIVRRSELPAPGLEELRTAVAEAVLNAMEHGNQYRRELYVVVQVTAAGNTLAVRVIDQGAGQPVEDPQEPDLAAKLAGEQSPRGWGLFLIKQMADDVRIRSSEGGVVVEMFWYLDEASRSEAQ
jgi:anti-sigma regulatory factor (Ser/Thr protein kinase)